MLKFIAHNILLGEIDCARGNFEVASLEKAMMNGWCVHIKVIGGWIIWEKFTCFYYQLEIFNVVHLKVKFSKFCNPFFDENFSKGFSKNLKTETLSSECFSRLSYNEKCDFKTMEINKFEIFLHFVTLLYLVLKLYARKFFLRFAERL